MIELCREAGLPEPDFELRAGSFIVTLWRDWLTDKVIAELILTTGRSGPSSFGTSQITNSQYQTVTGATRPTAKRDLEDLMKERTDPRRKEARGAHYQFGKKRLTNGSKARQLRSGQMADKWLIWLIGIRDSIPPAPSPSLFNTRRS